VATEITPAEPAQERSSPRRRVSARRLLVETVAICFRYRVTGLAAEAGFFALLSLPPLVLGLAGSLGYFTGVIGTDTVAQVQARILEFTATFLTQQSVAEVIKPTLEEVFTGPRVDLISLGFLISLWSGSRALNVYVDTISIMYGLGGRRGIVRTRVLSFTLYVSGLIVGAVLLPLVLAGPSLIDQLLPERLDWLIGYYWLVVPVLSVAGLTSLYHVSVPVRSPWWRGAPGAILALVIWMGGSFVVREVLSASVGGSSIYGPLATPIVILIWLYMLAIAVLIGAALNAATDVVWPSRVTTQARAQGGAGTPQPALPPGTLTPVLPHSAATAGSVTTRQDYRGFAGPSQPEVPR
jgi:membrane protein